MKWRRSRPFRRRGFAGSLEMGPWGIGPTAALPSRRWGRCRFPASRLEVGLTRPPCKQVGLHRSAIAALWDDVSLSRGCSQCARIGRPASAGGRCCLFRLVPDGGSTELGLRFPHGRFRVDRGRVLSLPGRVPTASKAGAVGPPFLLRARGRTYRHEGCRTEELSR